MKLRNFFAMSATLAVLLGTLAGINNVAYAQGAGKQGKAAGNRQASPMMVGLKAAEVTATQKDQIAVVAKKYADERRTLRKEMRPDTAATATPGERPKPSVAMKTKLDEIETKEVAEVKAILTPEQQTKFQTAYDAAKSSRGNNGPLDQMMEKLALTDEQKEKVTPILTETNEAMAKVRQDSSIERRDKMAKMAEIWTGAKAKIRPLLNPDQQKTLDELKALRGGAKRNNGAGAK